MYDMIDVKAAEALIHRINACLAAGDVRSARRVALTEGFVPLCKRLATCPMAAFELLRRQAEAWADRPSGSAA